MKTPSYKECVDELHEIQKQCENADKELYRLLKLAEESWASGISTEEDYWGIIDIASKQLGFTKTRMMNVLKKYKEV